MPAIDDFPALYTEAQALLQNARPDQIHEVARLLACQAAYSCRYHETLPIGELMQRIAAADKDN